MRAKYSACINMYSHIIMLFLFVPVTLPPWYCLWQLTAYLRHRAYIRQVTNKNLGGNLVAGSAAQTHRGKIKIKKTILSAQVFTALYYTIICIIIIRLVGRITLRLGARSVAYTRSICTMYACVCVCNTRTVQNYTPASFFFFSEVMH